MRQPVPRTKFVTMLVRGSGMCTNSSPMSSCSQNHDWGWGSGQSQTAVEATEETWTAVSGCRACAREVRLEGIALPWPFSCFHDDFAGAQARHAGFFTTLLDTQSEVSIDTSLSTPGNAPLNVLCVA